MPGMHFSSFLYSIFINENVILCSFLNSHLRRNLKLGTQIVVELNLFSGELGLLKTLTQQVKVPVAMSCQITCFSCDQCDGGHNSVYV